MYVFQIDPIGKPRMTQRDKWVRRERVQRYYMFKDFIRVNALNMKYKLGSELDIEFHLSLPKSWSQKKKDQMRGTPHQSKPDLDNMIKAFTDSLLDEDEAICKLTAAKYWSDTGYIVVKGTNERETLKKDTPLRQTA